MYQKSYPQPHKIGVENTWWLYIYIYNILSIYYIYIYFIPPLKRSNRKGLRVSTVRKSAVKCE